MIKQTVHNSECVFLYLSSFFRKISGIYSCMHACMHIIEHASASLHDGHISQPPVHQTPYSRTQSHTLISTKNLRDVELHFHFRTRFQFNHTKVAGFRFFSHSAFTVVSNSVLQDQFLTTIFGTRSTPFCGSQKPHFR